MLELKGELVFKTVAYHRAADAIGRSPVDLVVGLSGRATRRRSRASARPSATRSRELADDRPHGLLRPAAGRGPAEPRRAPADPGARPEDGPPAPRGARDRDARRPRAAPPRRAGCASVRGHVRPRPRRSSSRGSPGSSDRFDRMLPRPGRGARSTGLIDGPRARRPACTRSSRPARSAAARSRSATSTCSPRPTSRRRSSSAFTAFGMVDSVINRGGYKAAVRLHARAAGRPDDHAAGRGRAPTGSTSPARRSTTSGCARWPATGAGACPRRASCGSARTASR